jgi:hypothetical protein
MLSRAKMKFRIVGVSEQNVLTDYVNTAISYFAERSLPDDTWNETWQSDQHFVNAVVWKAIRLWRDDLKKRDRELEILPVVDKEGDEDDEGVMDYLIISKGIIEEQEKYERNIPDNICVQSEIVENALKAMNPSQRQAHLFLANGYTREEIAEMMGLNYDALCKILQRGSLAARRVLSN